ncbi:hypothetical protein [Deinococcus ficus]|uniref:Uncharacterized protein n=1 Tax=Deinococcus ficus TaxID=317577 RepID=A0A221ST65_9DEIO|nr:hypothetical protein [Deinococcus ficus]ASN79820.1 hypothetical protein DFI_01295 [Deinococcus ficus]
MGRFLKVADEAAWLNLNRVDVLAVRPHLQSTATREGGPALEELHEATGAFEVIVSFQEKLFPVRRFPTQAEAVAFVEGVLEGLDRQA